MKIFKFKGLLITLLFALFAFAIAPGSAAEKKAAGTEETGDISTTWLMWPKGFRCSSRMGKDREG